MIFFRYLQHLLFATFLLFIFLRELTQKIEHVLHQVAVAEVKRINQLLKHIRLAINQLLLEGREQPVKPGDNDLLRFRLYSNNHREGFGKKVII